MFLIFAATDCSFPEWVFWNLGQSHSRAPHRLQSLSAGTAADPVSAQRLPGHVHFEHHRQGGPSSCPQERCRNARSQAWMRGAGGEPAWARILTPASVTGLAAGSLAEGRGPQPRPTSENS